MFYLVGYSYVICEESHTLTARTTFGAVLKCLWLQLFYDRVRVRYVEN